MVAGGQSEVCAVVLAGGFGTRIRHLLPDLPKPMAPVAGKPFVEWVIRYLAAQGVRRVVLSTGHRADVVAAYFQPQPVPGVTMVCVAESQPLGTAGGFLNAVRQSGVSAAAWLVLNGDSLVLAPLREIFESLAKPGVGGALVGVRVPDAARFGTVQCNARGELAGFREKQPGAGLINAGVYFFRAGLLQGFPDRVPLSFESEVFPALLARGTRLRVCASSAPFLDIGTPESLPQADAFIQAHPGWFASPPG